MLGSFSLKKANEINIADGNEFMESLNAKIGIMFTTPEVKIIE